MVPYPNLAPLHGAPNLDETVDARTPTFPMNELVDLCAVDYRLFCKTFFPKTFRDDFPEFSDRLWDPLDSRRTKYINYQIFRGGSKTTTIRGFCAKRIAYGISRTIMIIAVSQEKAEKTVRWLKGAIARNQLFANTFQLRPGNKWTECEIEIVHGICQHTIAVVAYGITGNVRGINIDDYRPDFILIDDVINEENAANKEQRQKVEHLLLGAIANTLAPSSESPDVKMCMLQTPMNHEDASMKAAHDPQWVTVRQPCWTLESENLPIEFRESAWKKRFPSEELRQKKRGAIARNVHSLFAREMEVKLITAETSAFLREWLKFYDYDDLPPLNKMYTVLSIDPVPPPTDAEVARDLHGKNYEAISVLGYFQGKIYLLQYECNRGHDPSWTCKTTFDLATKWKVKQIVVETHAYQKTLAWLLNVAMQKLRLFIPIAERKDRRAKYDKIVDAHKLVAPFGNLYVHFSMSDYLNQFTDYPSVQFDDLLDSVAQGIDALMAIEIAESGDAFDDADDTPPLLGAYAAP